MNLDLNIATNKLIQKSTKTLHLYCDVLSVSNPTECLKFQLPCQICTLHIFARKLLAGVSELRCELFRDQTLFLYYDETASARKLVAYSLPMGRLEPGRDRVNADDSQTVEFRPNVVRNRASLLGAKIYRPDWPPRTVIAPVYSVACNEVDDRPLSMLQQFPNDARKRSILFDLLYKIFESVTTRMLDDTQTSTNISKLRFIIQCCRSSSSRANFTADAQRLLGRIETPYVCSLLSRPSGPMYYVPQLEPNIYQRSFERKLRNTVTREIKELLSVGQIQQRADLRAQSRTMLEAVKRSIAEFVDVEGSRQRAIAAAANCNKQQEVMKSHVAATKDALASFEKGIEAYRRRKEEEFEEEMVLDGAKLIVSVIVVVATCGAGAAEVVEKAKESTETVQRMSKMLPILKGIYEKIKEFGPKMLSAYQQHQAFRKRLEHLEKNHDYPDQFNSLSPEATSQMDYIGMQADWKEFSEKVDSMFVAIKQDLNGDIVDGMEDFKLSLKCQVQRGIAVIHAMREMQNTMQLYLHDSAALNDQTKMQQGLDDMITQSEQSLDVSMLHVALRWTAMQHHLRINTALFVDFHECLLSLMYQGLSTHEAKRLLESYPIRSMSTAQNNDILNELERANVNSTTRRNTMGYISISTDSNPTAFPSDWNNILHTEGRLPFHIKPHLLEETSYWRHIRITAAKAHFDGLDITNKKITWDWEFGPEAVDQGIDGSMIAYYVPKMRLRQTGGEGKWHDPDNQFVNPCLFCKGQIVLRDNSYLSHVSKATLVFTCEGVPV